MGFSCFLNEKKREKKEKKRRKRTVLWALKCNVDNSHEKLKEKIPAFMKNSNRCSLSFGIQTMLVPPMVSHAFLACRCNQNLDQPRKKLRRNQ